MYLTSAGVAGRVRPRKLDAGHADVSFALRNSALSRPAQSYLGLEKMIVD
jgi:hypothetical protein